MNLRVFPHTISTYESPYYCEEVIEIMKRNTFHGILSSTAYDTNKPFIGRVNETGFRIIGSSPKTSMFCVFEGKLSLGEGGPTMISITETFHPAFRVLFSAGAIALMLVIIFSEREFSELVIHCIAIFFTLALIRYFLLFKIFRDAKETGLIVLESLLILKKL